jgi:hypothetical protein
MRGDEPESRPVSAASDASNEPDSEKEPLEECFIPPANPLKAEEFKPSHMAQQIDLDAMRKLANSTSRNAVNASEKIRRKELGYVQIGIAVFSFFTSIYFFLFYSHGAMGFLLGLTCIGMAGFLGYRFYSSMKHNEMMESENGIDAEDQSEKTEIDTPRAALNAVRSWAVQQSNRVYDYARRIFLATRVGNAEEDSRS